MNNNIKLSPKKIVSKEFQVDFKGYNAQEVDSFLDTIVSDYKEFARLLNNALLKVEALNVELSKEQDCNKNLKNDNLVQEDRLQSMQESAFSNVDILRRISALEKAVFNQVK